MRLNQLILIPLTDKQKIRYWKKVNKQGPDECWPWTAAVGGPIGKMRGQMTIQTVHAISTRVGWFIVHGFDPYPLHVLHTCDNGICHNPAHWFRGTNADNCQDKAKKFRAGKKLTPEKVREIKTMRAAGQSQQEIADHFGVNQTLISFICRGVYWSHVV